MHQVFKSVRNLLISALMVHMVQLMTQFNNTLLIFKRPKEDRVSKVPRLGCLHEWPHGFSDLRTILIVVFLRFNLLR